MTKKYYTPTIEEFHIGFEFEKYDNRPAIYKENDFKPTNWHKHTYNLTSIRLSQLDTHLYNKTLRVKYLDKEDIESLGFRRDMIKNTLVNNFIFYKDNISLSFDNQINDLKISVLTKSERTCDLFVGHIKNISELKLLLKQLEIENVINATK